MSAAPPSSSLPSPSRRNPNNFSKPSNSSFSSSSRLCKPPDFPSLIYSKAQIRCDLTSFQNPQRWIVDCVSGSDPIHIIKSDRSPFNPVIVLRGRGENGAPSDDGGGGEEGGGFELADFLVEEETLSHMEKIEETLSHMEKQKTHRFEI